MIAAINGADFVLLVTEPTPFGLHDLILAVEAVKILNIPHGIVINRAGIGNDGVKNYAKKEGINRFLDHGNPDRGIITMGLPFLSLMDVLTEVEKKPDILKLGMVYPLPKNSILSFIETHKEVKVLEELTGKLRAWA